MNPAVEYLERDYDAPGRFVGWDTSSHVPSGLYQVVPDHPSGCCRSGEGPLYEETMATWGAPPTFTPLSDGGD